MRTWLLPCGLAAVLVGAHGGCDSKTPVPFKRDPAPAKAPDQLARTAPVPQSYADGTRSVQLAEHEVSRSDGAFRASLDWDLGGDGTLDSLVIATDAENHVHVEAWTPPAAEGTPQRRGSLALRVSEPGCALEQASLAPFAPELALATVHVSCAFDPALPSSADPASAPVLEAPTPEPGEPPNPFDQPPPAPGTRAVTVHQFVVTAQPDPKVLFHVAALPPDSPADTTTLALSVASQDRDADGHADVLVIAELGHEGQAEPSRVGLLWLNRPSGLARDRAEPEQTLAPLAEAAFKTASADPVAALPAASQVLDMHRLLCQESGAARIWVDENKGLACGPSAAAGRAAVVRALALAKQQQLLPALQARSQLDAPGFKIEPADRERVKAAIAAIRGQTSYVWQRGPDLAAPSSPSVRLPALGFVTADHLLLRGLIGQSYDLRTRVLSPSAFAQSVVMFAPGGRFAIVDMVRDCAGQYLRTVPASSIVSGFVAGGRGDDLPLVQEQPAAEGCTPGPRRPDRSGWTVLGVTARGALLARGATLQLVPFDADGRSAGAARLLGDREPAPPLLAAGALSANGLRHALATSEGVAVIERGAQPATTLIRSPASCTGRVSDVAISPAGDRVAMLCSGRVYWAHEAQAQAAAALVVPPPAPPTPPR